jgi:hypothetical protein
MRKDNYTLQPLSFLTRSRLKPSQTKEVATHVRVWRFQAASQFQAAAQVPAAPFLLPLPCHPLPLLVSSSIRLALPSDLASGWGCRVAGDPRLAPSVARLGDSPATLVPVPKVMTVAATTPFKWHLQSVTMEKPRYFLWFLRCVVQCSRK